MSIGGRVAVTSRALPVEVPVGPIGKTPIKTDSQRLAEMMEADVPFMNADGTENTEAVKLLNRVSDAMFDEAPPTGGAKSRRRRRTRRRVRGSR